MKYERCGDHTDNENDLGLCDSCIVDVETDEDGVTNQALLDVQGLKNRVEILESIANDLIDAVDFYDSEKELATVAVNISVRFKHILKK